jgi:hypothetical protein
MKHNSSSTTTETTTTKAHARTPAWVRDAVPAAEYDSIADALTSADGPVGIDARHTHVLILHALDRIERRLAALERKVQP